LFESFHVYMYLLGELLRIAMDFADGLSGIWEGPTRRTTTRDPLILPLSFYVKFCFRERLWPARGVSPPATLATWSSLHAHKCPNWRLLVRVLFQHGHKPHARSTRWSHAGDSSAVGELIDENSMNLVRWYHEILRNVQRHTKSVDWMFSDLYTGLLSDSDVEV